MDSCLQLLAAVEQDIKDLIDQRAALKKVERKLVLTSDEQEELARLDMRLADARASVKRYESFIKLAMKDEPPVTKSFSEADSEWIQAVTGVNTAYRRWGPVTLSMLQFNHGLASKQNLKNDIILREEFGGDLRIFPELQVTVVQTNGTKKRKLSGVTDYTVGFGKGKDIFDNTIPREVHLVAVEAKTSKGEQDLWQCVAEAASLYKTRVDAGKAKKRVWGILSNAKQWQFVHIDEDGLLWRSEEFLLDLRFYDESKVLQVYRIVYYIMKCCHEACTPPPSVAFSIIIPQKRARQWKWPQHEESWGKFLNKNYRTAQLVFTFVATYTAVVLSVGNLMIQPIKDSLKDLEKNQNQSMQKLEESQRHQSQDLINLLQTLSDDMKARDQRLSDKIDQVSGRVRHLDGQIGVVIEIARGSADLTK
ncbi:hypothetical protein MIR68_004371 [Amoeboaphelidium protococcarum]|nr:hypothetical protein MIR68_004371 [Amoeboaphelidium protococcarum]